VSVDESNLRWCSDGFEIGCWNKEKVRVAFALDCCDREAISWVGTTKGIDAGLVKDMMLAAVEQRFGSDATPPRPIEWLTDNGSLRRQRDTCLCKSHQHATPHHPGGEPSVQWDGRELCEDD
jgi:putative transposase